MFRMAIQVPEMVSWKQWYRVQLLVYYGIRPTWPKGWIRISWYWVGAKSMAWWLSSYGREAYGATRCNSIAPTVSTLTRLLFKQYEIAERKTFEAVQTAQHSPLLTLCAQATYPATTCPATNLSDDWLWTERVYRNGDLRSTSTLTFSTSASLFTLVFAWRLSSAAGSACVRGSLAKAWRRKAGLPV